MSQKINFNATLAKFYKAVQIYNDKVLKENFINSLYNQNILRESKKTGNLALHFKDTNINLIPGISSISVWDRNKIIEDYNNTNELLIYKEKIQTVKYYSNLIFEAILEKHSNPNYKIELQICKRTFKRNGDRLKEAGILFKVNSKSLSYKINPELIVYQEEV